MTEFLQLHALTSYPPANLNRDDLGRPKTAVFGGRNRLRISSQSLKRAWRQSAVFQEAVGSHRGWRTRDLGEFWVYDPLKAGKVDEKLALKTAEAIAGVFAKLDTADSKKRKKAHARTKQLVHVSPEEKAAIDALVATVLAERREPTTEELDLLRHDHRAADIALFGRMLADKPSFNVEAAAQVAHALTVHPVTIEDDYFTAVDDLNDRQEDLEDAGAGHVGESEFGAGVFYLYLCIDRDRLVENLQGDEELVRRTLRGLAEAVCTIAPSGKQNSFASRAYASFALAEKGDRQPRSLAVSFLGGIADGDYVSGAVQALDRQLRAFDKVYGQLARERCRFDVSAGEGSSSELADFFAAPAEIAS
jgi:CRISPR system Cascade subunit CasC